MKVEAKSNKYAYRHRCWVLYYCTIIDLCVFGQRFSGTQLTTAYLTTSVMYSFALILRAIKNHINTFQGFLWIWQSNFCVALRGRSNISKLDTVSVFEVLRKATEGHAIVFIITTTITTTTNNNNNTGGGCGGDVGLFRHIPTGMVRSRVCNRSVSCSPNLISCTRVRRCFQKFPNSSLRLRTLRSPASCHYVT